MKVEAILIARGLVMVALFPALAGCASREGEPLTRGDIDAGNAPPEPLAPAWASPEEALLRPGVLIHTPERDCLSNFFYRRADNGMLFLGTTAYCVRELPLGAGVLIGDDTAHVAALVYSSALTMQERGETDPDALEYNDLALFLLDPRAAGVANPTLPVVGGPTGMADGDAERLGDRVRAYARSGLPAATDWREGVVAGRAGDWALMTYQALPGAPGSMGGGVIDEEGRAIGVMVTLGLLPNPGANGVARLDTMLAYARDEGRMPVELVTADAP